MTVRVTVEGGADDLNKEIDVLRAELAYLTSVVESDDPTDPFPPALRAVLYAVEGGKWETLTNPRVGTADSDTIRRFVGEWKPA